MNLIDTGLSRDCVERESAKAYMFVIRSNGGGNLYSRGREVWLPKSQVTWQKSSPVYAETAHVPAWLAAKL